MNNDSNRDLITSAVEQRSPTETLEAAKASAVQPAIDVATNDRLEPPTSLQVGPRTGVPPTPSGHMRFEPSLQIPPLHSTPPESFLSTAERWQVTLDKAFKGVVTVRLTVLRAFEQARSGQSSATGFVVDRTRGILLSNRHVVNPGPITATAVFNGYEELGIEPLYADPVHDFGFFKFDPAQLKFAELEEIKLYPQGAKVGLDIKVCGNDGGELRSVLGGTIARLDRGSPYDHDFNTFYIQAASGTSTGSSGSPVLDIQGRAVALVAGGSTSSASSFYLPLDKVQRALELIQSGKAINRGTLQTIFRFFAYDMLRKLGLPEDMEKDSRQRHVGGTGLLTVTEVVPQGPGSVAGLQVGDILLKLQHPVLGERYVNNFDSVWDVLDEIVGERVQVTVYSGVKVKTLEALVQDLHSIIPNEFLEVGAAIIHPLSYQIARLNNIPCQGLVVTEAGMFNYHTIAVPFILTQVDEKRVKTLDDCIEVFSLLADRQKVRFQYRPYGNWQEHISALEVDHHFFGMNLFKRKSWVWERHVLCTASIEQQSDLPKTFDVERDMSWSEELRRNLVRVRCRLPFCIQGWTASSYIGIGTLVELEPIPMIVVSREIIPVSICDISIEICNRALPGTLIHLGLVAVVTVDRKLLHSELTAPKFSDKVFRIGDDIEDFSLDGANQLVQKSTKIKDMGLIGSVAAIPPSWRMRNVEGITFMDYLPSSGGVYIDPVDKSIVALSLPVNLSGNWGINYNFYIRSIIERIKKGEPLKQRCCGWNFSQEKLSDCLNSGLKQERAIRLVRLAKAQNTLPRPISVFGPLRPQVTTTSGEGLKIGDIIIEINDKPTIRMTDVHVLTEVESARVLISRNGEERLITLTTYEVQSEWTGRILWWSGAIFHRTHEAVLEQISPEFDVVSSVEGFPEPKEGVYMCSFFAGSPGSQMSNTSWVLEVDGSKVRTMDDMLDIVKRLKSKKNGEYVRVKMLYRTGTISVSSVRLDTKFWPTYTLEQKDGKWLRTEL